MASWSDHCPLCNAGARDAAGTLKHEAWCAHFMRGPDAGGDPAEWPTLLEELEPVDPCPSCIELLARGVPVTCEAGTYPELERPTHNAADGGRKEER